MAKIRHYVRPQRLYRYRSLKHLEREIGALTEGYLYCAPYMELNDPMEGLFTSSRLLRESDGYGDIRNAIRENKSQIGMSSFSEVDNHELMWAHYADQFKGICIAYSLEKLLDNLGANVSFVRMYYNELVPTVHRTHDEPSHLAKMILSYKNYRWLYEREWRMFAPLGKAHYNERDCVTRVYLGSRIDPKKRDRVLKEMQKIKIETHEMAIDKYSMSSEPAS